MNHIIDIISRLRQLDGNFSKREQLVADFVLSNLEVLPQLSQHEIAESAHVSVATVNRFCQSLGCDGFRDFQITLAQSIAVSLQYLCLLYTSPSPRDQRGTRMPSSA